MAPKLSLPRGWKHRVRSSVLHILALSHYTFTALLAKAALSKNRQVRLQVREHRIATVAARRENALEVRRSRGSLEGRYRDLTGIDPEAQTADFKFPSRPVERDFILAIPWQESARKRVGHDDAGLAR